MTKCTHILTVDVEDNPLRLESGIGVIAGWLDKVETNYHVLHIDAHALRAHARLMHRKSDAHFEDAMIAAVAQTNGLIVATRNVKDFAGFGVRTVDPFASR